MDAIHSAYVAVRSEIRLINPAKPLMLGALLSVLLACPASAQRTCDQFRTAITTTQLGPVERVAAIPNKRVYFCGYVLFPSPPGPSLEFEISTGTGLNCATNKTLLIPRVPLPPNGIVNRIPYAAGEFTPPGYAVCLQTWGTGSITSIFYWAQF